MRRRGIVLAGFLLALTVNAFAQCARVEVAWPALRSEAQDDATLELLAIILRGRLERTMGESKARGETTAQRGQVVSTSEVEAKEAQARAALIKGTAAELVEGISEGEFRQALKEWGNGCAVPLPCTRTELEARARELFTGSVRTVVADGPPRSR